MPVEYTKKPAPTTASVREVKDEPIDRPTVQTTGGQQYQTEDLAPLQPSPIFTALLAGEVANRGIGWYANAGPGQATRVALLRKTEREILAHYQEEE